MNGIYESEYITASFDTLMNQASDSTTVYLRRAKSEIDSIFGDGYAIKNPQLIAAFIQAAATDMSGATIAKVLGHALQELSSSIREVSDKLED